VLLEHDNHAARTRKFGEHLLETIEKFGLRPEDVGAPRLRWRADAECPAHHTFTGERDAAAPAGARDAIECGTKVLALDTVACADIAELETSERHGRTATGEQPRTRALATPRPERRLPARR
jgi:hypothetical protein